MTEIDLILFFFSSFIESYAHLLIPTKYFFFQRYKDADIEVTRKDGIMLLREIATEVKNFMDFKMNAVMVSYNSIFSLFHVIYV